MCLQWYIICPISFLSFPVLNSTSNHEIEVDLRNLCRMYDRLWLAEGHDLKDHKPGASSLACVIILHQRGTHK